MACGIERKNIFIFLTTGSRPPSGVCVCGGLQGQGLPAGGHDCLPLTMGALVQKVSVIPPHLMWRALFRVFIVAWVLTRCRAPCLSFQILFPLPNPPDYECDLNDLYWFPYRDKKSPEIPCLFFQQRKSPYCIVYVHGNACDLGSVYNEARYISDFLGIHLVAMELRGYGLSKGTPSEDAVNRDIEEVFYFLTAVLKFPKERIIFFGRSIGSGPCTRIVSRLNQRGIAPAALVLQSPFTSILDASRQFAGFAAAMLVPDLWKNLDEMKSVTSPLLIIHGKMDKLIPFTMGKALHDASPSKKKRLVLPPQANHNNFNLYSDILRPLAGFLAETGGLEAQPILLKLPKFVGHIPTYAWQHHPNFQVLSQRLRKARAEKPKPTPPRPMRRGGAKASRSGGEEDAKMAADADPARAIGSRAIGSPLTRDKVMASKNARNSRQRPLIQMINELKTRIQKLLLLSQRGARRVTVCFGDDLALPVLISLEKLLLYGLRSSGNPPSFWGVVTTAVRDSAVPARAREGATSDAGKSIPRKEINVKSKAPAPALSSSDTVDSGSAETGDLFPLNREAAGDRKADEERPQGAERESESDQVVSAGGTGAVLGDAVSNRSLSAARLKELNQFRKDVDFVKQLEIEESDVHCVWGRAWLRRLLNTKRLHMSLRSLAEKITSAAEKSGGRSAAYRSFSIFMQDDDCMERLLGTVMLCDYLEFNLALD